MDLGLAFVGSVSTCLSLSCRGSGEREENSLWTNILALP